VPVGGYIVVFDTITSKMAERGIIDKTRINNGPKEALEEFLQKNGSFEIDRSFNKYLYPTVQMVI